MILKHDESFGHQIVAGFDKVGTSAREWTERVWLSAYELSGKVHLSAGFGCYPNRNVIDAYGTLNVEGKTQYAVRASRVLRPNIEEMKVGPFSYQVVEPLKRLRFSLAPTEHDLSYEIEFDGTMPPHEEGIQYAEARGRAMEHIARYIQIGRMSGSVKLEGKTYNLDGGNWMAIRDHSWGVRRGGGVPETGVQPTYLPEGYLFHFNALHFDQWGASYHVREDWDGTPLHFSGGVFYPYGAGKEEIRLASVQHDLEFRQDIRQMKGGSIVLNAHNGSRWDISLRPLTACYLTLGGYFGYKGFVHGLWQGEEFLDAVKVDLTDPRVLNEVCFLSDQLCEARCGSESGYGLVELVVTGKYPRYGYQGY